MRNSTPKVWSLLCDQIKDFELTSMLGLETKTNNLSEIHIIISRTDQPIPTQDRMSE